MRVRYSFSSRKSKRAIDSPKMRKQREKYPDMIKRIIRESDIVLEILDARFIAETRNYEIENSARKSGKVLVFVMNKSDLVKKRKTRVTPSVFVSCRTGKGIKKLRDLIKKEAGRIKKEEKVVVGVIGYPNTGKSSLINMLVGKSSAGIGAEAGFTKGVQKLRLDKDIILLDTPGVIPEKEYSNTEKDRMAKSAIFGGRSYSQIKDPEMTIAKIIEEYPESLEKHYNLGAKNNAETILEELGKKWNCLRKKGEVDLDKTARRILKDWQEGKIKFA